MGEADWGPVSGSLDALDGAPPIALGKKLGDEGHPMHGWGDRSETSTFSLQAQSNFDSELGSSSHTPEAAQSPSPLFLSIKAPTFPPLLVQEPPGNARSVRRLRILRAISIM